MTPRDCNNILKAKGRNQVNSVFPLKGQLLIDLMILYLGSRHLFEVILLHLLEVRTQVWFIGFSYDQLVWAAWGSRTERIRSTRNASQMLQPQCPMRLCQNVAGGSQHRSSFCERGRSGESASINGKLRIHNNSNLAHHPGRTSYLPKIECTCCSFVWLAKYLHKGLKSRLDGRPSTFSDSLFGTVCLSFFVDWLTAPHGQI